MTLERKGFGGGGEGGDGGDGVAAVEDDGVGIVLVVHRAKGGVLVEHILLGFDAVVRDQFTGDADPLGAAAGADFRFGVGQQLLVHILDLAGFDVEFALEDFGGAEGADARLVSLDGSEEIGAALFEELLSLGSIREVDLFVYFKLSNN